MYLDGSSYKHQKKEDRQKNSVQHGRMSWRATPMNQGKEISILFSYLVIIS